MLPLTWSFDPPVITGLALGALLYVRGYNRMPVVLGRSGTRRRWQALSFFAGLAVVFVALESPIDAWSATLFWSHMIQHLLLIMLAAPLLLLGDPAVPLLRGVPLGARRSVLRLASRQGWVHDLGHVWRWITSPAPVLVIFLLDLYLWHWQRLFNLTLQNDTVHLIEHLCFIGTALLFWSQLIDLRAMRPRLRYWQRVVYVLVAGFGSNVLSMYLVFAPRPLYSAYAGLPSRPLHLTALADQQLAGAIMWVPVLFLFGTAAAVLFFKLLGQEDTSELSTQLGSYHVLGIGADAPGQG